MSEPPLVSVVIPAFNAARFLPDTLSSALDQTYGSIEVIVVDDGSTDGTYELAREFDPSIQVLRQDNGGVSKARNRGMAEAKGSYICFLDADDWLYPDNFELKVEVLEENRDLALAFGWVEVTTADLEPTGRILKGAEGDVLQALMEYIPPAIPCPSNALIRMDVVKSLGGFDENLSTSADFDLWLRIASRYSIGRVERVLVKYRRHDSAMFHDIDAQIHDKERIFEKHEMEFGRLPAWKVMKWRFYRSVAGACYHDRRFVKTAFYLLRGIWEGGFAGIPGKRYRTNLSGW